MLFLKRKDEDVKDAAPRRGSLLWKAVNPELGKSIRPLAQTASVFVQLIAMVFAMNGLFPKDHPGLTGGPDGTVRLRLSDVIRTAWNDLSFTEEGAPKVLLFFAVTGTIVLAILSVVTALMMGFVGTAHAQTGGSGVGNSTFFASAGANDLAQNMLDYIFKAQPISAAYSTTGQTIPQTVNIQCALQTALGFYSNAMLMFAAIILFYHLATMIVNTAHHGVVMGKQANQVWAPIRLVVAIGLLVPIGSGPAACSAGGPGSTGSGSGSAGMNSGQYIVVKMAELGSGMASQTWTTFLNALHGFNYKYIEPTTPFVNEVTGQIVMMEACRWAWDYQICKQDKITPNPDWQTTCGDPINGYSPSAPYQDQYIGPPQQITNTKNGDITYSYSTSTTDGKDICGSFTIPGKLQLQNAPNQIGSTLGTTLNPDQVAANLSNAQMTTMQSLLPRFATVGAEIAQQIKELNDAKPNSNIDYRQLVVDYQNQLDGALNAAFTAAGNPNINASQIASLGWAAAGAWLNTISRDQGSIVNAYQGGLPKNVISPDFDRLDASTVGGEIVPRIIDFDEWMSKGVTLPTAVADANSLSATGNCNLQAVAANGSSGTGGTGTTTAQVPQFKPEDIDKAIVGVGADTNVRDKIETLITMLGSGSSGGTILDKILDIIDTQAANNGVWKPDNTSGQCPTKPQFTLGAQLVTANPLAELAFWGYANLSAGYNLYADIFTYGEMSALKGADVNIKTYKAGPNADCNNNPSKPCIKEVAGQGLEARYLGYVSTILATIGGMFLTVGYSLAFLLPLFPFFRFFFAVMTWIVSVLEAVAAVSLIALAHLNPEGEGLPGQTAKAAYFMVFNVFLRPTMTIFGLIAGLIIFYIAIIFLNATYAIAVVGTGAMSHTEMATLIRLVYTLIYAATAYTCANTCFKTIDMFPDQALRWISANAHSERMGDDNQAAKAVLGQVQSYGGDKATNLIQLNRQN